MLAGDHKRQILERRLLELEAEQYQAEVHALSVAAGAKRVQEQLRSLKGGDDGRLSEDGVRQLRHDEPR